MEKNIDIISTFQETLIDVLLFIPNNLLEKSIEDYHKSKDLWSLTKKYLFL